MHLQAVGGRSSSETGLRQQNIKSAACHFSVQSGWQNFNQFDQKTYDIYILRYADPDILRLLYRPCDGRISTS